MFFFFFRGPALCQYKGIKKCFFYCDAQTRLILPMYWSRKLCLSFSQTRRLIFEAGVAVGILGEDVVVMVAVLCGSGKRVTLRVECVGFRPPQAVVEVWLDDLLKTVPT